MHLPSMPLAIQIFKVMSVVPTQSKAIKILVDMVHKNTEVND